MKNSLLISTFLVLIYIEVKGQSSAVIFEAHKNRNCVELNWNSKLPKKGGYFIIQRSQDARTWEEVLTVRCKGKGDQLVDYFELDNEPIKGNSFYRLKQISHSGDVFYSNVVPMCYKTEAQVSSFYPLTQDQITCNGDKKPWKDGEEYFVVLRDKTGNEYFCKAYIFEHDGALVAEPVEAILPQGTYLVVASNNNNLYSHHLAIRD